MDNEKKIPASKQIRQRNEDVIIKATEIITELESLESFSLEKKRPHMHYKVFRKELESFINRFERMLR